MNRTTLYSNFMQQLMIFSVNCMAQYDCNRECLFSNRLDARTTVCKMIEGFVTIESARRECAVIARVMTE